ncbi:hypothetical protein FTO70_03255 [Methanosarcina sp. KYL-1]|nr:hypothetical protein [Methanosarcina sp. KYL-1]
MQHLLSACSLAALMILVLIPGPCTAAFIPGNNITLENRGMAWDYEEHITGREAIFFREVADREAGNNDSFVNAWELLNMELQLQKKLGESIERKPDVKLNGSSNAVKVQDVEFWLSEEALGRVLKISPLTNTARVKYSFEKEAGQDTSLWFLGTPKSEVTITLPEGFDSNKTEGLENKSTMYEDNRMVLKGRFDSGGEITLWLSENDSFKAAYLMEAVNEIEAAENETIPAEPEQEETETSGFFKIFLRQLCLSPKA